MAAPRHDADPQDEAGAVLVLALIFLVAVSLIIGGLLTLVSSGLRTTSTYTTERSLESAATSAVNLAIQNTRYPTVSPAQKAAGSTPQLQLVNASPPLPCWFDTNSPPNWQQPPPIQNQQINVWCSMVWQPFSANTRTITYSACPSTLTSTQCAAKPTLQAIVTFDDYPPGINVPTANPVACEITGFCGQSLTQDSWLWSPMVPAVNSISPTSATITGNNAGTGQPQTVSISGTGFVQGGSSVNFVQETGAGGTPANTPSTVNSPAGVIVSIPTTQITWGGCSGSTCTLRVPAPSVTSGSDYFVTVTTPAGTSPYLSALNTFLDFQVSNVVPVVTASGGVQGGSITGGNLISLTGSGFYNAANFAAQVWFWPVGGGSRVQASNVNVTSSTTLTAISPAVTAPGNYYIQVDTFGGNSVNTSVLFNYAVQVPIILSLNPSSGSTGTFTIAGGNFLTGSTVGFCLVGTNGAYSQACVNNQTGGGQIATTATVTSASTITANIPSTLTKNAQYYPVVTLPSPYSSSSQPYNEPADIFTKQ